MLETEAGEQEGVEGGRGPRGILHIQGQETVGPQAGLLELVSCRHLKGKIKAGAKRG